MEADGSLLRWASQNGHIEVVKLLLEKGANIHADDDFSLRIASQQGHLEVVKLLIENGANVNAQDDYSLRWASQNGHIEVVKLLLENGADIHAVGDLSLRSDDRKRSCCWKLFYLLIFVLWLTICTIIQIIHPIEELNLYFFMWMSPVFILMGYNCCVMFILIKNLI
jgi:ankyrin repeat protein